MDLSKKKSVTEELLKQRAGADTEVVPGQWHASFKKSKLFAMQNNLPFVSVWTSGDLCGYCITLEKCFLDKSFVDFMKQSGYVYWLGTKADAGTDVINGKSWASDNGRLREYPFMRATWGSNDKAMSGNVWDERKTGSQGAECVIRRLKELFKDFAPVKTVEPVSPKKEETKETTEVNAAEQVVPAAEEVKPAKRIKIHFNPEWTKAQIKEFQKNIKANGGYCPCQEQSEDTKCMCKAFRELKDVPEEGALCTCGLYQKYWA